MKKVESPGARGGGKKGKKKKKARG